MSDRRLHFTVMARSDFRAIQRYTRRMWGEARRDEYASGLLAAMDRLTTFPSLGQDLPHLPIGMRRLVVEEHVIFYTADAESIRVIRILHRRRGDVDLIAE